MIIVAEWCSKRCLSSASAEFVDCNFDSGCIAFLRQTDTVRFCESNSTIATRVRIELESKLDLLVVATKQFELHYFSFSDTAFWQLVSCSITGLIIWLCICFSMRYTLKLLLMYKGWMYESREKGQSISTATKLWATVTRVLSSWNKPGLYSFQGSLPRLPLPSVHETMERVGKKYQINQCSRSDTYIHQLRYSPSSSHPTHILIIRSINLTVPSLGPPSTGR